MKVLRKTYPGATTALRFSTPFELLIATILSAQCTDERVNQVTQRLFKKYRLPQDYLRVDPSELEQDIRQTGFYRNKTKSIRACCKGLVEKYKGEVPDELDELVTLGGVGRKTANLVLGCAYNKPGITVDTHVKRVVGRLELSKETKKANAMLAGLGSSRRVYLSDTLLEAFDDDQIAVVFAHELGHHIRRHIFKTIGLSAVVSSLLVALGVGNSGSPSLATMRPR